MNTVPILPTRVVAQPLVQAVPLSSIIPDERAGSISDLVGHTVHLYRVERFHSANYDADGFRLVLRTVIDGVETSGDMLITGFAKPVLRVVNILLGGPDTILKELHPPVVAEVIALGSSVGLK
jgi:hypothetical protein